MYTIKLNVDGRVFGANRKNVILNVRTRVTLIDLSSAAHNGFMGRILEIDRNVQQYDIFAQNRQHFKINFENVLC